MIYNPVVPLSLRFSAALALAVIAAPMFSQSPAPAFEVASVKTVYDNKTWAIRHVDTQLYRSQTNAMQLLTWAWKVRNFQISGAPAWLTEDRFEIQGTTGHPVGDDRVRLMLQSLLADRFRLKIHRETRELPVYVLVIGKSGSKLLKSNGQPEPGTRGININAGKLVARDGAMDALAEVLTTNLDRPVLDQTGLTGGYDFTLTWDQPGAATAADPTAWSPMGPAIFTPIQSLGLKLEARKAPVEMLVIDSIDHPSEN
jgi:uncharacterized protein (TIGR03435 family)